MEIERLDGVELLRLRHPNAAASYLIVPGNPGAAGFYVPFMASLRSLYRADVTALSFPGHERLNPSTRCLSLQETIHLVRNVVAAFSDTTIVVGHSIGAYIALHAAGPRRVVAVFPLLQVNEASWRQRLLRRLIRYDATPILAPLRGMIPLFLRHAHAAEQAQRCCTRTGLASSLTLARHEFAELTRPIQDAVPWKESKTVVLWTDHDHWFPLDHRDQVPARVVPIPGVRHSFCIDPAQSRRVALSCGAPPDCPPAP